MEKKKPGFFKGSGLFIGAAVFYVLHEFLDLNVVLSILSGSIVAIIISLTLEKKKRR
ncbi:hypothetical protein ES703_49403 [subsurface metagenome]